MIRVVFTALIAALGTFVSRQLYLPVVLSVPHAHTASPQLHNHPHLLGVKVANAFQHRSNAGKADQSFARGYLWLPIL
jgi:hypothetical protein